MTIAEKNRIIQELEARLANKAKPTSPRKSAPSPTRFRPVDSDEQKVRLEALEVKLLKQEGEAFNQQLELAST